MMSANGPGRARVSAREGPRVPGAELNLPEDLRALEQASDRPDAQGALTRLIQLGVLRVAPAPGDRVRIVEYRPDASPHWRGPVRGR